jgi:hypothetical protein
MVVWYVGSPELAGELQGLSRQYGRKDHFPDPAEAPPWTAPKTVTRRISIETVRSLSVALDTGQMVDCFYLAFGDSALQKVTPDISYDSDKIGAVCC